MFVFASPPAVHAEEARFFAPSRSTLTGFLSCDASRLRFPPLLSTNGFSVHMVSSIPYPETHVNLMAVRLIILFFRLAFNKLINS